MPEFPFIPSNGAMADRIRRHDWASTPLGAPSSWPTELKTAINLLIESSFPKAIVWGPGLTTIYNDAFRPILGNKPEALGRSFADVWSEVWPQLQPMVDDAFAGQATFIENFPLVIERSGRPEQTYFTFCYSPVRLADGSIAGMMDTVIETTQAVEALAARKLINEELGHRLKNMFAMVSALSMQTLSNASERPEVDAFNKRLISLSRANDILMQQDWTRASLRDVTRATLEAISDISRIDIDGDDIDIGAKAVLSLSLVLHELATNAAKYGALSAPGGRVAVTSAVDGGTLTLTWRESGGPPVTKPTRLGFGTRLIKMGIGGNVATDFNADGLVVRLTAPVDELKQA